MLKITLLCACVSSKHVWGYEKDGLGRIESSEKSSQKSWNVIRIICINIRLSAYWVIFVIDDDDDDDDR